MQRPVIELKSQSANTNVNYMNELLRYVEKVVFVVLQDNGITCGEICSNLMIHRNYPPCLELVYFGTFLMGRTKLTLPLNPDSVSPGAAEAYYLNKTMYIDNTMSDTYRRFFSEAKPYRSIISIPIQDGSGGVFAVLNIDSDVQGQFSSTDFINKKILPAVNSLILLVKLEKDLLVIGP